ncbi:PHOSPHATIDYLINOSITOL-4-PHOSPHATE 5-KINASE RELATED [Salix viminalis]|uniref:PHOSPHATIDYLINOSITOL-4-PHOSPHATE 5-KINASE RELATED n=1 Tax=Salix viminalis TaxID=40686 RepID=A0A9Q0ZD43_SALVM|nr:PHOSPHATIDYLINOSITOL-4-PHOSPHATE 5-KINASE RELATED [Salix viminalis]
MHQKKSEIQIGKESTGVSSDFSTTLNPQVLILHHLQQQSDPITPPSPPCSSPTPYKRPLLTTTTHHSQTPHRSNSLSKSPTIYHFAKTHQPQSLFSATTSVKAAAFRFLRPRLARLKVHFRLILLLSLPFFYFLVSHPSHSFLLDFLSAFAFSAALLLSLNLALPRLPSIRLFLSRSFAVNKLRSSASRPPLPVFWSIGSRQKSEKKATSGCFVQDYSNGDVYEGDWVDGKYDGYGVETWARGSRYRGQYRQGLRHGFGVYRFYTGDVYAGEWSNGQSHGCGIHTCEEGSRYVGKFKWGVKHGLGHYHFRNGDTYAGEYFADKMHGFGVYCFANGHRYEGAWHEGRRQGLGMYTFRNGETQSGHWQNGILNVPSTQNTSHPVSPVAVYHSKVLNAVQEARRAAEKAYDVAKVDERVNRAVAAANRAANAARVAAVKAVQKQMHHNSNNYNIPLPIV